MAFDQVRTLLLQRAIGQLPPDARLALCCAGKFLTRHWHTLRSILDRRRVVLILDDSARPCGLEGLEHVPVQPVDEVTSGLPDAVIITSDRMEDRMVRRFADLLPETVEVIRTTRVEQNRAITPDAIHALVESGEFDLTDRPEPWRQPCPDLPLGAGLEITNGCNLNCLMCDTHSSRRPKGQMDLDLFARGLDALEAIGCNHLIYHTVGEPTIHRAFSDILRLSHKRGFDVFLSTNGMLIDRFADDLIRYPVATLRFSIDGATRETYERIRAGARFDTLLANLAMMRRAIDENALPTAMQIDVTLSRDNLDEVPLFFDVFGPFVGEEHIRFSPLNSLAAGEGDYYDGARLVETHQRMVPCYLLWEALYVGYDGRVSACCRDYHGELIVGDLREKTLAEIWHGEPLQRLRERHRSGNVERLPRPCRTCYSPGGPVAELLSYLIASLRRTSPELPPAEVASRLLAFLERVNALPNPRPLAV